MNYVIRLTFRYIPACLLLMLAAGAALAQEPAQEAENAVQRFYQAFFKQQWSEAADAMHPEALDTLHRVLIHIAETTDNLKERKQFLKEFGNVETIAAFKNIPPKTVFVRLYQEMWKTMTPEYRRMWQDSHLKVIGSVKEDDLYHVVVRTNATIGGIASSIVSVASVKRDKDNLWKVYTSVEFERMIQKLRQ